MITIVSGIARSGTSLMMRMLGAGGMGLYTSDHAPGPGSQNPRGYYEVDLADELRAGDGSWTAEAEGRALKLVAYWLKRLPEGPDYRVIYMVRALGEVATSQDLMQQSRGHDHMDRAVLAASICRETYRGLESLAHHRWPVLLVHYDRVLRCPIETARRVAAFIEEPVDPHAMAEVVETDLRHHDEQAEVCPPEVERRLKALGYA